MTTKAEFQDLPAFAKDSLTRAAAAMNRAKTRLGVSEDRFTKKVADVESVADMYDAASDEVDRMMTELAGNQGPTLDSPAKSQGFIMPALNGSDPARGV